MRSSNLDKTERTSDSWARLTTPVNPADAGQRQYQTGRRALHSLPLSIAVKIPFMLYGWLLLLSGLAIYITGVLIGLPRLLFGFPALLPFNYWLVWYSGIPTLMGLLLVVFDVAVLLPWKRKPRVIEAKPVAPRNITVVLTAYNDQESIGMAVREFRAHRAVSRVIVVSNNSRDQTLTRAREAGAEAVNEPHPGYGQCVYRCLQEALRAGDSEIIVLCEGDMTFRAYDIDKLLTYLPHADVVNGTRIVEQLREFHTQLSTFMYYGNFFAGKLLEVKHLGKGTFTDVGTTYKAIHRDALERLLPHLRPHVNLEFNAHFMDVVLSRGEAMVECPITFHARVGQSKGGNVNNARAIKVGLRMIAGMLFGWRWLEQRPH